MKWRVILRYSLDGTDTARLRREIKELLENKVLPAGDGWGLKRTGTSKWESLSLEPGAAKQLLSMVLEELAKNAGLLDHLWIYIDQANETNVPNS